MSQYDSFSDTIKNLDNVLKDTNEPKPHKFTPGPGGGGGGYNDDPKNEFTIEIPIQPKPQSVELDENAKSYVQKLWPCEPPCDSYGICSNCCERKCFHAGYELANKFQEAQLAEMSALLVKYRLIMANQLGYLQRLSEKYPKQEAKVRQKFIVGLIKALSEPLPKGWAGG